jgi:hypothetical protein
VSGKVSLFYFRSPTHFYVVLQVFKWMNWFYLKFIDASLNMSVEGSDRQAYDKHKWTMWSKQLHSIPEVRPNLSHV